MTSYAAGGLLGALDPLTRRWWRTVGHPLDLTGEHAEHAWLRAPTADGSQVRDGWLDAAARAVGGRVREGVTGAGLLPDLAVLDGPGFRAGDLAPQVRDFYQHTADWRMEVWAGWNPLLRPGGELVARLFGRRVEQLALPTRPLDVARGMDSRVSVIEDADGLQVAAGWLRTLRATGDYVFSGCYTHRRLPGHARDSVHVAFPLERGNVQVFLRPEHGERGALWLHSPPGRFGDDGAYVVVEDRGDHGSRAPIHETFHVFVDDEGVLRTDHVLRLGAVTAVRLHYRLERRA